VQSSTLALYGLVPIGGANSSTSALRLSRAAQKSRHHRGKSRSLRTGPKDQLTRWRVPARGMHLSTRQLSWKIRQPTSCPDSASGFLPNRLAVTASALEDSGRGLNPGHLLWKSPHGAHSPYQHAPSGLDLRPTPSSMPRSCGFLSVVRSSCGDSDVSGAACVRDVLIRWVSRRSAASAARRCPSAPSPNQSLQPPGRPSHVGASRRSAGPAGAGPTLPLESYHCWCGGASSSAAGS
jgi:hypothetical protein